MRHNAYHILLVSLFALAGCGGNGSGQSSDAGSGSGALPGLISASGGATNPEARYVISGQVTGLMPGQSLTLDNLSSLGTDSVQVTGNGSFQFQNREAAGAPVNIRLGALPDGETCQITNGQGTVSTHNDNSLIIACTDRPAQTFQVGGVVNGLDGVLELQLNGADTTVIQGDGNFVMNRSLYDQATYDITVASQPVGQTCTVNHAEGTVQSADVHSIGITCEDNQPVSFSVGGSIEGLRGTLVLQNRASGGQPLTGFVASGPFTLSAPVQEGAPYDVTIVQQPVGQICTITNPGGTMGHTEVSDITVSCAAGPTYTVSVRVLIGFTMKGVVVLQNNNSDDIRVTGDGGTFNFPTQLGVGATYNVTIKQVSPGLQCNKVRNGSGVITGNVSNIEVACVAAVTNVSAPSSR